MRFDAALRATHGRRRFGNVQLLPITHQKGFPLTSGQFAYFILDGQQNLCPFCDLFSTFGSRVAVSMLHSLQQIKVSVLILRVEVAQVGEQGASDFLPPEPVQRAVRQDTLKEHRQLGRRFVPVVFSQFHHAVLNNVKRRLFVANVIKGTFEGPLFNALQKVGEFLFVCQEDLR